MRARRVVVLVEGEVGSAMGGPAIRGWEIARRLAEHHPVDVVAHNAEAATVDGIRVSPLTRRTLLGAARRCDAVLAPWVPPYLLWWLAGRPTLTVSDLYDPLELELDVPERGAAAVREVRAAVALTDLQLRFADALLCGGEAQRAAIAARLDEILPAGRRPTLDVVPFGLPDRPPPSSAAAPLRRRFHQIEEGDTVVLWWGTPWRWLDAATAVRAVAALAGRRSDVKLVIAAGRPPGPGAARLSATEEVRALARRLGVIDRTVLFLDDWVPYTSRHDVLLDADIGICLHGGTSEAPVAARARYLDYLWAGVPCVLAHGDETAARMVRAGCAVGVAAGDEQATTAALLRLADAPPDERRRARAAAAEMARSLGWDRAVGPLLARLEEGVAKRDVGRLACAPAMARYYARRLPVVLGRG